ncbi:thymidine phosphorylase [bacterium]|nr:thymidine phosphorylase [bacterium]
MRIQDILRKKRDKEKLTKEEIVFLINGYTSGDITDYQMAAFAMAAFLNGLDADETANLTFEMMKSGSVVDFGDFKGFLVDKHSTGGVGDKISIPLAPLVASCGVYIPMISGRGLGHTGGTLDKLESVPGFNVNLSLEQFIETTKEIGVCLIGQTAEITPADKKLYALRDATSTVESISLITASIMSKKLAEGIKGLVLDVKVGTGAFMKTVEDARKLAESMVAIGKKMDRTVTAVISNMDQPLGEMIGNSLEMLESFETLKGRGPADIKDLTFRLGAEMLKMAGVVKTDEEAFQLFEKKIASGEAGEKMKEILKAHGADPKAFDDYSILPIAEKKYSFLAPEDGYITKFNTEEVGVSAMLLGAGRKTKEDIIDPSVGIALHKKLGDYVKKGDVVATLYYQDDNKLSQGVDRLKGAIFYSSEKPVEFKLVLDKIHS